jgi:hypothetical protein
MAFTWDVSEVRDLAANCDALAAADIALPVVTLLAETWIDVSSSRVPVDTGQTKARTVVKSVQAQGKRATAEVVSDTPYAGFIDRGTSTVPPRPYWRQGMAAAERQAADLGGQIEREVSRLVESGGVWNPRALR